MVTRQRTEVFSRITGFIRPLSQWNPGKAQEFKDRKVFNVSKALLK
jgi:ribonucleoside-triphosphate reductase